MENPETHELAVRFFHVMELSFRKLAQDKLFPTSHAVFKRLNVNQIRALHVLHHRPGLTQKQMAECLQITPAAVSTAISEMAELELVERQADSADRRQVRLNLSELGKKAISENESLRYKAVANLLDALPIEEQRMIVEALERAVKSRFEEDGTGPPGLPF